MKGFFATIGLCALTLALTVLYYEGLRLPFVGQIINGAVANRQEPLIRSYEVQAAKAVADEKQRQATASKAATDTLNAQLASAKAAEAKASADLDKKVKAYEQQLAAAHRDCALDTTDIDFLLHDGGAADGLGHH